MHSRPARLVEKKNNNKQNLSCAFWVDSMWHLVFHTEHIK